VQFEENVHKGLEEVSVSNHSVEDLLDEHTFIWVLKLFDIFVAVGIKGFDNVVEGLDALNSVVDQF
jgi:hypothetical protein